MKQTIYYFLLTLLIFPLISNAQNAFKASGIVSRVDFQAGEIVIGDMFYKLGQTVTIYDQKGGIISKNNVKPGGKIGFTPSYNSTTRTIYELWVLPSSFDLKSVPNPMMLLSPGS